MSAPGADVRLAQCENCGRPVIEIVAIGGPEDGRSMAACLSREAFTALASRMLVIAKLGGNDLMTEITERALREYRESGGR